MPLASDRQVNEKPFEIGMNSQKSAGFDPLSWEKIAKKDGGPPLTLPDIDQQVKNRQKQRTAE